MYRIHNLATTKLALVCLVLALAFLANLKYRQYQNQKSIEAEKQKLLSQADALQKRNNELEESLTYMNSSA